jgi:hypothetical protein
MNLVLAHVVDLANLPSPRMHAARNIPDLIKGMIKGPQPLQFHLFPGCSPCIPATDEEFEAQGDFVTRELDKVSERKGFGTTEDGHEKPFGDRIIAIHPDARYVITLRQFASTFVIDDADKGQPQAELEEDVVAGRRRLSMSPYNCVIGMRLGELHAAPTYGAKGGTIQVKTHRSGIIRPLPKFDRFRNWTFSR